MDDLQERMERLARRVDTAAAPDLEQVRQRHTRRRTRSALVVGLVVALVAVFAASRLVVTGDPVVPAKEPRPGAPVVWPQADVNAEWRSDPEQLLQRFAYLVLGWSTPEIVGTGETGAYEMRPQACPATARCTPALTLTVEQADGVWSISSISHPQLAIEVGLADPRVALTGGSSVAFDLELPDNVSAHIGMVVSNNCRQATAFEVGLDSGPHELLLPAEGPDDPGCDDMGVGYLFAYATDDTTVPVGDPFLEAAGIEYPWITAVPIYLQMEEADATETATPAINGPDVLSVSCYGDQMTSVGDTVLAQADGVHLLIEGQNAYVEVSIDDQLRRIEDAPKELVLPLAPGVHTVECILPGADQVPDPKPFEVIDPAGFWVDPESLCTIAGIADFEPITVREEDMVAGEWQGLLGVSPGVDGASIEPAGYPESDRERIYVVFRGEGDPVGIVWFEPDADDLWTSTGLATCA